MIFFNPLIQAHGKKNIVCPFWAVILSKMHTERAHRQGDPTLESAAGTVPHLARVKRVSVESRLHFCWVSFGDLASTVCHGRLPDWVVWPLRWPFSVRLSQKKVSVESWLQFCWVGFRVVFLTLSAFGDLRLQLSVTAGGGRLSCNLPVTDWHF